MSISLYAKNNFPRVWQGQSIGHFPSLLRSSTPPTMAMRGMWSSVERRRSSRFRVKCEVTCTWVDDAGVSNTTCGFTNDISAAGVFVQSGHRPPAGALANVKIQVPRQLPWGQQLRLHGSARLVRWVQDNTDNGFALASAGGWTMSRPSHEMAARAS
jgi:hypothetical protein